MIIIIGKTIPIIVLQKNRNRYYIFIYIEQIIVSINYFKNYFFGAYIMFCIAI